MNSKGCNFLEFGINFDLDTVCDCCISHNDGRGLPILLDNYHGELINWEDLFNKKQQRINAQKENTIYDCEGCYHLCDYEFSKERKISEFHFSHCRLCNAKCIYCSDEYSGGFQNYNVYPVIKDLIEKGYYKAGGEATFQGGEPTVMQNFNELIQLFIDNGTKIRVHTSGILYSENVARALADDKGSVVISLDSATAKTYKSIKQVDKFNSVCETIKKYTAAKAENVIIKYIIVPGYNDNLKEIDAFFKLVNKYNVKTIAFDIEVQYARMYYNKDVSPHIFLLYDYFELCAKKFNVNLLTYSFFLYVLKNRNIDKTSLINNKFLYVWYLNKCKNKDKNIKYHR